MPTLEQIKRDIPVIHATLRSLSRRLRQKEILVQDGAAPAGVDTCCHVLDINRLNGTLYYKDVNGVWQPVPGGGGGGGTVMSVTGLNTDNTDPANPIVQISVNGTTITGLGTPGSPLVGVIPTLQQVITAGDVLTAANTINASTFKQTITGAVAANPTFNVINTDAGGGLLVDSQSSGGIGAVIQSFQGRSAQFLHFTNTANAVSSNILLRNGAFSNAGTNFGLSIDIDLMTTATPLYRNAHKLISKWTTSADATRTSQFIIQGVATAILADLFTLSGTGALKLNKYGVGTFSGTPAYILQTDSSGNIIETSTLSIAKGGTGQSTANTALNALLPNQAGNNNFTLLTNGTDTSWFDIISIILGAGSGLTSSGGNINLGGVLSQPASLGLATFDLDFNSPSGSGIIISSTGVSELGDVDVNVNGTIVSVNDSTQKIRLNAANGTIISQQHEYNIDISVVDATFITAGIKEIVVGNATGFLHLPDPTTVPEQTIQLYILDVIGAKVDATAGSTVYDKTNTGISGSVLPIGNYSFTSVNGFWREN